jgi:hypothetical protein
LNRPSAFVPNNSIQRRWKFLVSGEPNFFWRSPLLGLVNALSGCVGQPVKLGPSTSVRASGRRVEGLPLSVVHGTLELYGLVVLLQGDLRKRADEGPIVFDNGLDGGRTARATQPLPQGPA